MNKEYIFDPLYGRISLPDFIWDILSSPELQRLREVRLCNINSLCLTGGANINRYEHAIGTCHLVQQCLDYWPPLNPINYKEKKHLLLAGLLHDVASAAFGHSLEYIESNEGFNHENAFKYIAGIEKESSYKYKHATYEPIFFGVPGDLSSRIDSDDLAKIGDIIAGKSKFGPLINSAMDLDNIDNIFRLAYHIGLVKTGEVPLNLARSIYVDNNGIILMDEAIPAAKEWHEIRKILYSILLLNREEFSAKSMLTEAIEAAKIKGSSHIKWNYVDFQFLEVLSKTPTTRINVDKYLFSIDILRDMIPEDDITNEDLQSAFRSYGIELNVHTKIERTRDGWIVCDGNINYSINRNNDKYDVYKATIIAVDVSEIITRLMTGNLYGCIAIFSSKKTDNYKKLTNFISKIELENDLSQIIRHTFPDKFRSALINLHPIIDINKTERQLSIRTNARRSVCIGTPSKRMLIGVFFKNKNLNIYGLNRMSDQLLDMVRQEIFIYMSKALDDKELIEVEPGAELR